MQSYFDPREALAQACAPRGPRSRRRSRGVHFVERALSALEDTETARCCEDGLSALRATLVAMCGAGQHVLADRGLNPGTRRFLQEVLPREAGVHTRFVDTTDPSLVESALAPGVCALLVEPVTGPDLRVSDLPGLAASARVHKVPLVVDNTQTPMVVTPARHGAKVVIHDLGRYLLGTRGTAAGIVCGDRTWIEALHPRFSFLPTSLDPPSAPQAGFALSHLALRMAEHGQRALALAQNLREAGVDVAYPGLPDHPDATRVAEQWNPGLGHGAVLTLDTRAPAVAEELVDMLCAAGFGYRAKAAPAHETALSILAGPDGCRSVLRMAVGYAGTPTLRWAQLATALRAMGLLPGESSHTRRL